MFVLATTDSYRLMVLPDNHLLSSNTVRILVTDNDVVDRIFAVVDIHRDMTR